MGYFVPMGLGTISEDGSELVTNTGSGITKAGWGGGRPPPIAPNDAENQCEILARKARASKATGGALVTANGDTGDTQVLIKDGRALVNFDVTYCGQRTVKWQFGDGATSAIKSPPHTYTTEGMYQVNVVATCITPSDECKPAVVAGEITVYVKEVCKLEKIQGECIAEYGKSLSFTTDTNYTDRTEWSVDKGGNPATFMGEPFDLTFSKITDKYSYSSKIEATCKAELDGEEDIIIDKVIKSAFSCSKYEPLIQNTGFDASIEPAHGEDIYGVALITKSKLIVNSCISSDNKWQYRFKFPSVYDNARLINEAISGKTTIEGPNDIKITNNNCRSVIRDFTPSKSTSYGIKIAPYKKYLPPSIILVHEMTHVADMRSMVVDVMFDEVLAKRAELEEYFSDCGSLKPNSNKLQRWFKRRWRKNYKLYRKHKEHEKRAYMVENNVLAAWVVAIRKRAADNGWRKQCQ